MWIAFIVGVVAAMVVRPPIKSTWDELDNSE